jgi:tetratricopeptide (TPR) repeat protein
MTSVRIGSIVTAAALALAGCATTPKPEVKPVVEAPPKPVERTPEERFSDAVKAFEAGRYGEAREGFTAVLQKQPGNVNVLFNLGLVAEKEGRVPEALSFYEKAHQASAEHVPTLLNLGRVYRLQDRFTDAIALYEKALANEKHARDVELLNNLATAYRLAKAYDKAEATARKVLERSKDNAEAYKNLSLIYFEQGNYSLARFVNEKVLQLDEKDPGVYNNYGMILLKLNDRAGALAQFKKAVSLDDAFLPGHMNIGAMALSYRDYAGAEAAFKKAAQLAPNSYEASLYLAYALDGQKSRNPKKGVEAGEAFEKVLAIKPDHTEAVCAAGWAYASEKSGYERAVGFLERCKAQPGLEPVEVARLDGRLKALANQLKSGQPQAAEPQKKQAPKAPAGTNLLEKAAQEAEAAEAAEAAQEGGTPAEGQTPTP